jgi:hypothetical protein
MWRVERVRLTIKVRADAVYALQSFAVESQARRTRHLIKIKASRTEHGLSCSLRACPSTLKNLTNFSTYRSKPVHETHELRIHGRGGQGAVLACSILAQALIEEGKHAVAIPSFGFERRGARSRMRG